MVSLLIDGELLGALSRFVDGGAADGGDSGGFPGGGENVSTIPTT